MATIPKQLMTKVATTTPPKNNANLRPARASYGVLKKIKTKAKLKHK